MQPLQHKQGTILARLSRTQTLVLVLVLETPYHSTRHESKAATSASLQHTLHLTSRNVVSSLACCTTACLYVPSAYAVFLFLRFVLTFYGSGLGLCLWLGRDGTSMGWGEVHVLD